MVSLKSTHHTMAKMTCHDCSAVLYIATDMSAKAATVMDSSTMLFSMAMIASGSGSECMEQAIQGQGMRQNLSQARTRQLAKQPLEFPSIWLHAFQQRGDTQRGAMLHAPGEECSSDGPPAPSAPAPLKRRQ